MSVETYDPEQAPNPSEWVEGDVDYLIMLIEAFHTNAGIEVGEGSGLG